MPQRACDATPATATERAATRNILPGDENSTRAIDWNGYVQLGAARTTTGWMMGGLMMTANPLLCARLVFSRYVRYHI